MSIFDKLTQESQAENISWARINLLRKKRWTDGWKSDWVVLFVMRGVISNCREGNASVALDSSISNRLLPWELRTLVWYYAFF